MFEVVGLAHERGAYAYEADLQQGLHLIESVGGFALDCLSRTRSVKLGTGNRRQLIGDELIQPSNWSVAPLTLIFTHRALLYPLSMDSEETPTRRRVHGLAYERSGVALINAASIHAGVLGAHEILHLLHHRPPNHSATDTAHCMQPNCVAAANLSVRREVVMPDAVIADDRSPWQEMSLTRWAGVPVAICGDCRQEFAGKGAAALDARVAAFTTPGGARKHLVKHKFFR